MEFIDLKTQQRRIISSLDARIAAVLTHGQYIMGPEVAELEAKLAARTGARCCIACASGSTALDLVLTAWGVGPGDAVFTTPLSFISTAESIARTGATPVFADIDPRSFNLDPAHLELAVEAVRRGDASLYPLPRQALHCRLRPRAVIAVDLFGNPADYDPILSLARKHNLLTLEDGAQGFGARYKDRNLCNCGCHAATTSFFPAKPLGCYGDGGAVFTNDAELAAKVDSLRYHGRIDARHKNDNVRLGCNGRLDTLQAAVLLAKLEIFEEEVGERQIVAQRYEHLLEGIPGLELPSVARESLSVWAQYTVLLPEGTDRDALRRLMKNRGIPTAVNYPKGMHIQGCLAHLGYTPHDMPFTQEVCGRVLSLPMSAYLTPEDQKHVVKALRAGLAGEAQ